MILVAGGSGTLGRLVVERLTARGVPVRVLTRDASRASHLAQKNVEVVEGDVRNVSSLERALADVSLVISAVHGFAGPGGVSPDSIDRRGNFNLIDAATKANAGFILMSIVGAAPDNAMELGRAKYAAEQYLKQSGIPWTIVRATAYMETWAKVMGDPLLKTGKTMVFGGGTNPINFVSAFDVAALIDFKVAESQLQGRVHEIGGTRNMTFNQFAEELQAVLGRAAKVKHVPRPALRAMSLAMRIPNATLARQAAAAVVMDTRDMTFDSSPIRRDLPSLPDTDLRTALSRYFDARLNSESAVTLA